MKVRSSKGNGDKQNHLDSLSLRLSENERGRESHGLEAGRKWKLRDMEQQSEAAEATGKTNDGSASLEYQKVETE